MDLHENPHWRGGKSVCSACFAYLCTLLGGFFFGVSLVIVFVTLGMLLSLGCDQVQDEWQAARVIQPYARLVPGMVVREPPRHRSYKGHRDQVQRWAGPLQRVP